MSDLVDKYNKSDSPRVKDARTIPGLAVNYFDRENQTQIDFTPFAKLKKTDFTDSALNSLDKRVQEFSVPESFTPIDIGIPLNRWNDKKKYYNPGQSHG